MALMVDQHLVIQAANQCFFSRTGWRHDQVCGKDFKFLFSNDNQDDSALDEIASFSSDSMKSAKAYVLRCQDGTSLSVTIAIRKKRDGNTDSSQHLVLLHECENALCAGSEDSSKTTSLEMIMSQMKDMIYLVGMDLRIQWVSDSAKQVTGFHPEEIIGKSVYYFLHPDDVGRIQELQGAFLEKRQSRLVQARHCCDDGSYVWLEAAVSFVENEDSSLHTLIMNLRDISSWRRSREALADNEFRYRGLFEFGGDAMLLLEDGVIVTANAQAEALFGLDRQQLVGMTPYDLSPLFQPDGQKSGIKGARYSQVALEGRRQQFEWRHRNQQKEEIDTEVTLSHLPGEANNLLVASIRDMTRYKQAETARHAMERRMLQTQKMESLGVLAGGIAHDFNNFLMGIMGNASLALLEIDETSQAGESIHAIIKAAQRSSDLCKQLLAYSGKGTFSTEPVKLSDVIIDMGHLLKASIGKNVQVDYRLAVDLPPVDADITQLRQVLMNLITNASEAIGQKNGTISLVTGIAQGKEPWVKNLNHGLPLREGPYVYLQVVDDGCGMASDELEKIFDPFYSTKFLGRGLGLAAVLGIVRGHDGVLNVESEKNKGTTFSLFLKASCSAIDRAESSQDEIAAGMQLTGNGTVLVVDDEPLVRAVTAKILRNSGYEVLLAEDGEQAVQSFGKHQTEICAVLLDMSMPRMSGEAVFQELLQIDDDVRVVLTSGYTEEEARRRFKGKEPASFLQKPYRPRDILLAMEVVRKSV